MHSESYFEQCSLLGNWLCFQVKGYCDQVLCLTMLSWQLQTLRETREPRRNMTWEQSCLQILCWETAENGLGFKWKRMNQDMITPLAVIWYTYNTACISGCLEQPASRLILIKRCSKESLNCELKYLGWTKKQYTIMYFYSLLNLHDFNCVWLFIEGISEDIKSGIDEKLLWISLHLISRADESFVRRSCQGDTVDEFRFEHFNNEL